MLQNLGRAHLLAKIYIALDEVGGDGENAKMYCGGGIRSLIRHELLPRRRNIRHRRPTEAPQYNPPECWRGFEEVVVLDLFYSATKYQLF
jgi:hypothetical protein